MTAIKYTLDRIEDGYAIFLKYLDEIEQIILPISSIGKPINEGDVVTIEEIGDVYHIEILAKETTAQQKAVADLLEKIQQRL